MRLPAENGENMRKSKGKTGNSNKNMVYSYNQCIGDDPGKLTVSAEE